MIAPVDLALLRTLFNNMKGRVKYDLGSKAHTLAEDSHEIREIDCSGFVRYALARATNGEMVLPDGSWSQREWCAEHGLHRLATYRNVGLPTVQADPTRLFIAFIKPGAIRPGAAGHVWLVNGGRTLESMGGKGVSSRPWNASVLLQHCCEAYELPTAPST